MDEGPLIEGRVTASTSGRIGGQNTLSHTLIPYWCPPSLTPHWKREGDVSRSGKWDIQHFSQETLFETILSFFFSVKIHYKTMAVVI